MGMRKDVTTLSKVAVDTLVSSAWDEGLKNNKQRAL